MSYVRRELYLDKVSGGGNGEEASQQGVVPALRSQCGTVTCCGLASARKELLQVFTCMRAI